MRSWGTPHWKLRHLLLSLETKETLEPTVAANLDCCLVEPERRQWRWLNFVAFWIADSLNVVGSALPPHCD